MLVFFWLINSVAFISMCIYRRAPNHVFFHFLEIFSEINFEKTTLFVGLLSWFQSNQFWIIYLSIYLYLEITLCMFLLLGTGLRSWFIGEPREFFLTLGAGSVPLISEPTADPRLETGWTFNPESVPMMEPEFKPAVELDR